MMSGVASSSKDDARHGTSGAPHSGTAPETAPSDNLCTSRASTSRTKQPPSSDSRSHSPTQGSASTQCEHVSAEEDSARSDDVSSVGRVTTPTKLDSRATQDRSFSAAAALPEPRGPLPTRRPVRNPRISQEHDSDHLDKSPDQKQNEPHIHVSDSVPDPSYAHERPHLSNTARLSGSAGQPSEERMRSRSPTITPLISPKDNGKEDPSCSPTQEQEGSFNTQLSASDTSFLVDESFPACPNSVDPASPATFKEQGKGQDKVFRATSETQQPFSPRPVPQARRRRSSRPSDDINTKLASTSINESTEPKQLQGSRAGSETTASVKPTASSAESATRNAVATTTRAKRAGTRAPTAPVARYASSTRASAARAAASNADSKQDQATKSTGGSAHPGPDSHHALSRPRIVNPPATGGKPVRDKQVTGSQQAGTRAARPAMSTSGRRKIGRTASENGNDNRKSIAAPPAAVAQDSLKPANLKSSTTSTTPLTNVSRDASSTVRRTTSGAGPGHPPGSKNTSTASSTLQGSTVSHTFSPPANMGGSHVTPDRRVPARSRFSATASGFPGLVESIQEDLTSEAVDTVARPRDHSSTAFASHADEDANSSSSGSTLASPRPGPVENAARRTSTGEGLEEQKVRGDASPSIVPSDPVDTKVSPVKSNQASANASTAVAAPGGSQGQPPAKRPAGAARGRARPRNSTNLGTGHSTGSAQTAAMRRRLQTGFGEILPSFQRQNANGKVPQSAPIQSCDGTIPDHKIARRTSAQIMPQTQPRQEQAAPSNVPPKSGPIKESEHARKRTTTLPVPSASKPAAEPMLPPLNVPPLNKPAYQSADKSSTSNVDVRPRLTSANSANALLSKPSASTNSTNGRSKSGRLSPSRLARFVQSELALATADNASNSSTTNTDDKAKACSEASTNNENSNNTRIPRAIAALRAVGAAVDPVSCKPRSSSMYPEKANEAGDAEASTVLARVVEHSHDATEDVFESDYHSPSRTTSPQSVLAVLSAYTRAQTEPEIDYARRQARKLLQSSELTISEQGLLRSLLAADPNKVPSGNKGKKDEVTDFGPSTKPDSSSLSSFPVSAAGKRRATMSLTVPATSGSTSRDARGRPSTLGQSEPSISVRGSNAKTGQAHGRASNFSHGALQPWDDERSGDEEMAALARRAEMKKRKAGASQEDIEAMLRPPPPGPTAKALSRRQAEVIYGPHLTAYEMHEMTEYNVFYYCGQNARNKFVPFLDQPANNFGYDDDRGDYKAVSRDHLAYRYEVMDLLGRGSFGQVLRCKDHKTGHWVALKLIRNKRRLQEQALIEVDILGHLSEWDSEEKHNVLRMTESFSFRGHLCIATELLSINLYELIKANGFEGLSLRLVRRMTAQTLCALNLLQKHKVVHCDLKPENILLCHPTKSAIKVIDYGSSCFETQQVYTYIQSRFYRSPEVILGLPYHAAIDMWSLGCIVAELYTGYPLFPGENEQEQLARIMEVFGPPDKYLIDRSARRKFFFDPAGHPRPVKDSKKRARRPGSKTLAQLVRGRGTGKPLSSVSQQGQQRLNAGTGTGSSSVGANGAGKGATGLAAAQAQEDLFIDFISRCLLWDPERRIKPDQALRHPWILAGRKQNPVTTTTIASSSSPFMAPAGPAVLQREQEHGRA